MADVETRVVVDGKGSTVREAFGDALAKIQKELSKKADKIVIRIEPLEVEVIEGKEYMRIEKFMFFFMKREVKQYEIKVDVKLRYFEIDIDSIEFEKIHIKNRFYI